MPTVVELDLDRTPVRRLEFVEVRSDPDEEPEHRLRRRKPEHATRPRPSAADADVAVTAGVTATGEAEAHEAIRPQPGSAEPRWSLWSDGEI